MISDVPSWDRAESFVLRDGSAITLRDVFPKSGCYDAITLEPIWQVDWFAFNWNLETSADFTHVVWLHEKAMKGGAALEFYTNGELVRAYRCLDLLKHMNSALLLDFTSANWHSEWYDWRSFQLAGCDRLYLSTGRRQFWMSGHQFDLGYQEHYTFDLATGEIREITYTGVDRLIIVIIELVALVIGAPLISFWLIRRLVRRIRRARIPAGHCRRCGYNLAGNISGICSECGIAVHVSPPQKPAAA
jgi:hypothetical protein